jgi:hypothetical protein
MDASDRVEYSGGTKSNIDGRPSRRGLRGDKGRLRGDMRRVLMGMGRIFGGTAIAAATAAAMIAFALAGIGVLAWRAAVAIPAIQRSGRPRHAASLPH